MSDIRRTHQTGKKLGFDYCVEQEIVLLGKPNKAGHQVVTLNSPSREP